MKFGNDVTLECIDGYYPNGASTISCSDLGQLLPPPSTIRCSPLVCDTPTLNDYVELTTSTMQFGEQRKLIT